jgi:propanol-preferring alcohol dehydrogenase
MLLHAAGRPLALAEVPRPAAAAGQVLLRVRACGVCRTDLHVIDGDLPHPKLPLVLGHQIVGEVVERGPGAELASGARVGVPWLAWTCGACDPCRRGLENLCVRGRFTGYHVDGGFAEYAVADARFCFAIPERYSDVHAAPLLCAGLIGYRAYRLAGDAERLGLYGFGAAAHLLAQLARHDGREVYAFTRPGDEAGQRFARELGATWAGSSGDRPPAAQGAAIIFAAAGELVPAALAALAPGGTVVCGGIHMTDIPSFPYRLLWEERAIRSVANLTRRDGWEYLPKAAAVPVETTVEVFPLDAANEALDRLRRGDVRGAAVLVLGRTQAPDQEPE